MYFKQDFTARLTCLLTVIVTLAISSPSLASDSDGTGQIILNKDVPSYILGRNLQFLEDPSRNLTIGQISSLPYSDRFVDYDKDFPSFGFSESAFWFRIEFLNPAPKEKSYILEEIIPYIDSIKVFTPDGQNPGQFTLSETGDKLPFQHREIDHHSFLFNIELPAESSIPLFIRVESRAALITPFRLWQNQAFFNHSGNTLFAFGCFYGILVLIIIYTLYLYVRMQDRNYLLFIFFVVSIAMMVATSHGLSYKYLWPDSTYLAERMQVVCISLVQLSGILFARSFLNTRDNLPWIDRTLVTLLALHSLIIGTVFFIDDVVPLAKTTTMAIQFYAPILFLSGYLCWRRGNRAARFYLFAWTSSIIGSLVTGLTLLNILPYHFIFLNAITIGFLLDSTLLSLALADRLYVLRQERNRARQLAHDNLQVAKEDLEQEVIRRTRELATAKREADQANQAKTQFLSHMSHELRTPLNGILGFSELLLDDDAPELPPRQKKSAQIIHDSGSHLSGLIDDILDISMIETGRINLKSEVVSFRDCLDKAMVVIDTNARTRNIQLINKTDRNEPFMVFADPLRLRQIIINLISNAVKYSSEGCLVSVGLKRRGENIIFSVRDNGPGIAARDMATIFEPFTRLKESSGTTDGIGIGLSITRKLVELMQGRILVESVVGKGSTFSVEFREVAPEARPDNTDTCFSADNEEQQRVQAAPDDDRPRGLVLYVEDNKANQCYVSHIFKKRPGIELICSESGAEGVNLARQNSPDVILTDISLPDISGFDVLKKIRENRQTSRIPVIAVSANANETDIYREATSGFDAYLSKPLGINELLDIVDNLLNPNISME